MIVALFYNGHNQDVTLYTDKTNIKMNVKQYLGDLIGGSLMIAESRVIAETLLKHLPEDEWKRLIIEENILQKKSLHTGIRYARTIRYRLEPLGDEFIRDLLTSTERQYIQLLMLAFLIQSPIVVDFMKQELLEVRRVYKTTLSANIWDEFIDGCIRANPELGKFSESSIKKMGNNAIKVLVDSGYLNSTRERELQPVYLLPEVKSWLNKLKRDDLIGVMECTV